MRCIVQCHLSHIYFIIERKDVKMNKNTLFMKVDEVVEELGVSKPYAYKLMRQLNDELSAKGFVTISGRVSRQFFEEKVYGKTMKEVS